MKNFSFYCGIFCVRKERKTAWKNSLNADTISHKFYFLLWKNKKFSYFLQQKKLRVPSTVTLEMTMKKIVKLK